MGDEDDLNHIAQPWVAADSENSHFLYLYVMAGVQSIEIRGPNLNLPQSDTDNFLDLRIRLPQILPGVSLPSKLMPCIDPLFIHAYLEALRPHYPLQAGGSVLLPFRRLFVLAKNQSIRGISNKNR
jgi:hypothetical protein